MAVALVPAVSALLPLMCGAEKCRSKGRRIGVFGSSFALPIIGCDFENFTFAVFSLASVFVAAAAVGDIISVIALAVSGDEGMHWQSFSGVSLFPVPVPVDGCDGAVVGHC